MRNLFCYISILVFVQVQAQISDFNTIDFAKADNIAKLNGGKSLDNLPLLTHSLTSRLDTDAEKFRAIYFWVCHNIKGDNKQSDLVSRKRRKFKNNSDRFVNWNDTYKDKAFKTLLKHKKPCVLVMPI